MKYLSFKFRRKKFVFLAALAAASALTSSATQAQDFRTGQMPTVDPKYTPQTLAPKVISDDATHDVFKAAFANLAGRDRADVMVNAMKADPTFSAFVSCINPKSDIADRIDERYNQPGFKGAKELDAFLNTWMDAKIGECLVTAYQKHPFSVDNVGLFQCQDADYTRLQSKYEASLASLKKFVKLPAQFVKEGRKSASISEKAFPKYCETAEKVRTMTDKLETESASDFAKMDQDYRIREDAALEINAAFRNLEAVGSR